MLDYAAWVLVRLSYLFARVGHSCQMSVIGSAPVRDCIKYIKLCSGNYFFMCNAFIKSSFHNLFLVGLKNLTHQRMIKIIDGKRDNYFLSV